MKLRFRKKIFLIFLLLNVIFWCAVEKRIQAESSIFKFQEYKKEYEEACSQRQTVRDMSMPFHTHFASVFVTADVDMKRIVNGADAIDILRVADLYSLKRYATRQASFLQNTTFKPTRRLSRYWFQPAEYQFTEQQDWVVLDKCEISLLTEEQYLTEDNHIKGSGRADTLAEKMVDSFTTYYTYIAQKRRIFRQL